MSKLLYIIISISLFCACNQKPNSNNDSFIMNDSTIKQAISITEEYIPIFDTIKKEELSHYLKATEDKYLQLIITRNNIAFDTLSEVKIRKDYYSIEDYSDTSKLYVSGPYFKLEDYNFDGHCDIIITDDASASHGTMSTYYFLYNDSLGKFTNDVSLPHRAGGILIDSYKKEIVIYCSYKDCKGGYKYNGKDFDLIWGKYTNEP